MVLNFGFTLNLSGNLNFKYSDIQWHSQPVKWKLLGMKPRHKFFLSSPSDFLYSQVWEPMNEELPVPAVSPSATLQCVINETDLFSSYPHLRLSSFIIYPSDLAPLMLILTDFHMGEGGVMELETVIYSLPGSVFWTTGPHYIWRCQRPHFVDLPQTVKMTWEERSKRGWVGVIPESVRTLEWGIIQPQKVKQHDSITWNPQVTDCQIDSHYFRRPQLLLSSRRHIKDIPISNCGQNPYKEKYKPPSLKLGLRVHSNTKTLLNFKNGHHRFRG